MDSLITAAARALAAGDALGALQRVALRDDAPALALRGIAMAQLGEHARARLLLKRASRAFTAGERLERARCAVAEAEVALAMRELGGAPRALAAAIATLEAHGDRRNALHARLLLVRRLLVVGRLAEAERALAQLPTEGRSPALEAIAALAAADLALRALRTGPARAALARAHAAALSAGVPALAAEVEQAQAALARPAARLQEAGAERTLRLDEVEALLAGDVLLVDGCRHVVRRGPRVISLARRPVLFALARTLGLRGDEGATREQLIADAFGARRPNDSHRARLRVEIGRLRALVAPLGTLAATPSGFRLAARDGGPLAVLLPPIDGESASLLALLGDGEAWSTSALALALGESQRTVQRALAALEQAGQVRSLGRARARRWLAPPLAGFATMLLLPAALPIGA
jgi:hypothetical protein